MLHSLLLGPLDPPARKTSRRDVTDFMGNGVGPLRGRDVPRLEALRGHRQGDRHLRVGDTITAGRDVERQISSVLRSTSHTSSKSKSRTKQVNAQVSKLADNTGVALEPDFRYPEPARL